MHFHLLAILLPATATATPSLATRQSVAEGTTFTLLLQAPGTAANNELVQAASDGLGVGLASQGAIGCTANSATFIIKGGELLLYTPAGIEQKVYADSASTDQGGLHYYTTLNGHSISTGAQTHGWAISGTDVTFNNLGVVGCSQPVGGQQPKFKLGINVSPSNGGGYVGCSQASLKAIPSTAAQRCTYSYSRTS